MAWEVWNVEQLEVQARPTRRLSGAGRGHRGCGEEADGSLRLWEPGSDAVFPRIFSDEATAAGLEGAQRETSNQIHPILAGGLSCRRSVIRHAADVNQQNRESDQIFAFVLRHHHLYDDVILNLTL